MKWKKFKICLTQVVHFCCCIIVHFLQSAPWLLQVITNGNGFCMRPKWLAINISPWVQVHSVFLGALFMQPAQCIGIWVIARVYRRVEVFPCPASGSRASRTRFHSLMPSDIRSRRIFSFCSICTRRVNDNNSNVLRERRDIVVPISIVSCFPWLGFLSPNASSLRGLISILKRASEKCARARNMNTPTHIFFLVAAWKLIIMLCICWNFYFIFFMRQCMFCVAVDNKQSLNGIAVEFWGKYLMWIKYSLPTFAT